MDNEGRRVVEMGYSFECTTCGTKGSLETQTDYDEWNKSVDGLSEALRYVCPVCGKQTGVIEGSEYTETTTMGDAQLPEELKSHWKWHLSEGAVYNLLRVKTELLAKGLASSQQQLMRELDKVLNSISYITDVLL